MKILIISSDYHSQPHKTIVDNIIQNLSSNYYQFTISNDKQIIGHKDTKVIYFLNIMDIIKSPKLQEFLKNSKIPCCTSIRSHRAGLEYPAILADILPHFAAVSADNMKMLIYSMCQAEEYTKDLTPDEDIFITPHSADETMFKEIIPINPKAEKLTVGYVGSFRKDKRYEIFKTATEHISDKLIIKTAGKVSKKLAFDEMQSYYNQVQLLVCCSEMEGGPTPPLEAALCGRMTLTTKCGFMEEAFKDSAMYFDGTVQDLVEKLQFLAKNRKILIEMGKKAKETVKNRWNWRILSKNYQKMFEYCYESKK